MNQAHLNIVGSYKGPWITADYDHEQLWMRLTAEGEKALVELSESPEWGTDQLTHEFFEHMIANSELEWIDPEDTGDMTEAPIIGVLGGESTMRAGLYGYRHVGRWDDADRYQPILARWAWMSYQVRYILDELLELGAVSLKS